MFHTFVSVVGFSMCFFDACLRTRAVFPWSQRGCLVGGRRRGTQAASGLDYEPLKEAREVVTRGLYLSAYSGRSHHSLLLRLCTELGRP